ncbi:hypothetical protein K431DRAFT_219470 [Polychaeton citri CBS 116435]|uniref:SRP9 domain-containing protein n=1 Tax=Polychaeton citri CBS 116435 TaxID=1314669 RepID=A0A9P4UT20_9PEZI|nr:hypothetical protein K431DRAFT_219470 [Polychaeton citri CBS 116435]
MVLLETSEEWQKQTSLLLEARPTSARITTKYNIPNLDAPKYQKPNKRKRDAANIETADGEKEAAPRVPKATLVLKTFCPESGVVLQYRTDRAQEVGRLIASLGRMGRRMAALPDAPEGWSTILAMQCVL